MILATVWADDLGIVVSHLLQECWKSSSTRLQKSASVTVRRCGRRGNPRRRTLMASRISIDAAGSELT